MENEAPDPEISAEELIAAVEAGEEIHILDVRAPERLQAGRIDIVPEDWFSNIKGSELLQHEDLNDAGLDQDIPLVVVCGLGNDSRRIARHFAEAGYRANSLRGGMAAWMRTIVARELAAPPELDHFLQLDRIGKGALGYLLVSDGEAMIVDPPRHTAPYVDRITQLGAKLVAVADTHAHADYISGGPALAASFGVPYYLHPKDAIYPYDGTQGPVEHTAVYNGTMIPVGRAEVEVLHTPGHTEGSVTYRVGSHFALTGDFLFVHSVGRPDLGGKTEEWTGILWQSLENARHEWPPQLEIYPAHYGSPLERRPDHVVGSSMAELMEINEAMRIDDPQAFLAWVKGRAGSFPEAYRRIKGINVGLVKVDEVEAEQLEAGKNQCALSR